MMFRRVDGLAAGDAVRPFDDRLWRVVDLVPVGSGRVLMRVAHPEDGEVEVAACLSDLVRLA